MANSLSLGANAVAGLGTFSYTVVSPGFYTLADESTLPNGSSLQVVLSQSGSASVSVTVGGSSTNPTPTQPLLGTSVRLQCVAGDVLSAALTSSANVDNLPNGVKSVVNLFQGE